MDNPWTGCGAAFAPMMGETVGLSGVRKGGAKVATSFAASVFPDEDEAPLADSDVATPVRRVSVAALAEALAGAVPQVGDALTLADGTRWLVCRAERALGVWRMTARSDERK